MRDVRAFHESLREIGQKNFGRRAATQALRRVFGDGVGAAGFAGVAGERGADVFFETLFGGVGGYGIVFSF